MADPSLPSPSEPGRKNTRRFHASRAQNILVPLFLGLLALILLGVVIVTVLAVLGWIPG